MSKSFQNSKIYQFLDKVKFFGLRKIYYLGKNLLWQPKKILKYIIFQNLSYLFEDKKIIFSNNTGVTTLLCHKYVDMFIYSIMSFFYQTEMNLPVYVIDDGTLTDKDKRRLRKYFYITFESRETADLKMKKIIDKSKYKNFYAYRFTKHTSLTKWKFDAILLCPFSRVIYIDSDVLFFKRPMEIINWIQSKSKYSLYLTYSWKRKESIKAWDFDYSYRLLLFKHLSLLELLKKPLFNTGLLCIANKKIIDFSRLNEIFKLFRETAYDKSFGAEEVAMGLLFNSHKNTKMLLRDKHLVAPFNTDYIEGFSNKTVCVHYLYKSKIRFQRKAIEIALRSNFFRL